MVVQPNTSLPTPLKDLRWVCALCVVAAIGIFLRVYPSATFAHIGYDENLYRNYVNQLYTTGITEYPSIVESYIMEQRKLPGSILPPMRFLYIFTSSVWKHCFGGATLGVLHSVACLFSIFTLIVSGVFAFRLGGKETCLAVSSLVACAPTQIHMGQHALVDGFFTFWALLTLWLFWEALQKPGGKRWLIFYAASFACMVMTKENSFFVFFAICGIMCVARWLKLGQVSRPLVLMTVAGPLLGVCILIALAGGIGNFVETYHLSVTKNLVLPYAIKTGDGPWYRYLVDLMLVSPLVLMLAIGRIFELKPTDRQEIFLTLIILFSYLIMANLKYGMNLRYANMWDLPLRYLAYGLLATLCARCGRWRDHCLAGSIAGICIFEVHQYYVFFVSFGLYELISEGLLRAVNILK